ncbi:hypothetical protein KIPB_004734 [Kipferlia bialata]|uniref:Protein kinase domain-containing protein n=1 Tax=Kipferlia bialata TaxID=797122 RepID=A0A391NL03_9EUKA|nr:hypothetical protein KIPB_004734 [Kipferlia bialata]|eukprot:g4734.t1
MHQISKGLQVLSQQRIIHRNLKPDNIMLDLSGPVPVVKITSLTWCYILEEDAACHEPGCGNLLYRAPERYARDQNYPYGSEGPDDRPEYGTAADVFATGLIFNQMVKSDWVLRHVRCESDLHDLYLQGNFE